MEQLFLLYKKMLQLHIQTKTTDLLFHQASEGFYNLLFECFHTIAEKRQDLSIDPSIDCDKAGQSAYTVIMEAQKIIESMIKEKNSAGMDNLLRSLADKLEFSCGTAKGFAMEDIKETPKLGIPKPLLKK